MDAAPIVTLATPHPVYGLHWSADGERLAFSGGYLYGGGFVGLANRSGRIVALRDHASLVDDPRVDGEVILPAVCLDDTGEWLAAAACAYKWHTRGPLRFRCVDDRLELIDAPELAEGDDERYPSGHATGIWIHGGRLLVRYQARDLEEALVEWPLPASIHADERRAPLAGGRITVIDDVVWFAKNQANVYSSAGTGRPMTPGSDLRLIVNPHGLVCRDLRDPSATLRLHPTDDDERCNVIVRDRGGERILAGLVDRRIVEWRVVDRVGLEQVRSWVHPEGRRRPLVVAGVQGLAWLADGETLVSAEQGGSIALSRDGAVIDHFALPGWWSPRVVAAHPREPWIAVGCKGGQGYEPGVVLLYDLGGRV